MADDKSTIRQPSGETIDLSWFQGRRRADLTKYLTKIRPFNRPAVREEKNKEVLI